MTEEQQRQELHSKIWKIADDVRGAVDGWDFKQYVLGILFYRFISENFQIILKMEILILIIDLFRKSGSLLKLKTMPLKQRVTLSCLVSCFQMWLKKRIRMKILIRI